MLQGSTCFSCMIESSSPKQREEQVPLVPQSCSLPRKNIDRVGVVRSFCERMCQVAITGGLPQLLCGPSVGRTSCDPHMDHLARWQFDDEEGEERTEEQVGDLQAHRRPRYPRHDGEGRSPSSAHVVESCAPVSCISEWCVCCLEYLT